MDNSKDSTSQSIKDNGSAEIRESQREKVSSPASSYKSEKDMVGDINQDLTVTAADADDIPDVPTSAQSISVGHGENRDILTDKRLTSSTNVTPEVLGPSSNTNQDNSSSEPSTNMWQDIQAAALPPQTGHSSQNSVPTNPNNTACGSTGHCQDVVVSPNSDISAMPCSGVGQVHSSGLSPDRVSHRNTNTGSVDHICGTSCSYVHASLYDSDPFFFSDPDNFPTSHCTATSARHNSCESQQPSGTNSRISRQFSTKRTFSAQASVLSEVDLNDEVDYHIDSVTVKDQSTCTTYLSPAVDSPLSWLVLVFAMLAILLVDGFVFTTGMRLADWQEHFKCDTMKIPALISSLLFGIYFLAAPFASVLVALTDLRMVGVAGSTLAALGVFLSSAAGHNILILLASYALIAGTGCILLNVASIVAVNIYFERYRSLALILTSCASGAGIAAFSSLHTTFKMNFHWTEVHYIHGTCFTLCIFGSMVFRPIKQGSRGMEHFCCVIKGVFNFRMFRNITFCSIIFIHFSATLGLIELFQFLPSYIKVEHNMTDEHMDTTFIVVGVASIVSHLLVAVIIHLMALQAVGILSVGIIGGGIIVLLHHLLKSYAFLYSYGAIFGLIIAMDCGLSTTILNHIVGSGYTTGAYGIICLCRGLAAVISGPLGAELHCMTNSWESSLYLAGSVIILSGILGLVNWFRARSSSYISDLVVDQEGESSPFLQSGASYGSVQVF